MKRGDAGMKKGNSRKKMKLGTRRAITGFIFILPWFIGFCAFYVKTLIQTVGFSLSDVIFQETGGYITEFVGLKNFRYALLEHGTFNQVLTDSLIGMVIDVPLIIFFSLMMALLLNQKFHGRTLMRALLFLPVIMGSGAVNDAIELARQAVQGGIGVESAEFAAEASGVSVEYFLGLFSQLGFPQQIIEYIIDAVERIYEVIKASGVQIIIFLAALQSVPSSLYEVSKIEGATGYETFWKVTFPMVSPLILTNVVYTIVDSFVNSEVVDTAYDAAFNSMNYGLSSAMSLISTVLVCLVLIIVGWLISRKTFYYN